MADVVQLRPPPENLTWGCQCGCVTFKVFTDGRLECAACDSRDYPGNGEWMEPLPDPAEAKAKKADKVGTKIVNLQNMEPRHALTHMLRAAQEYVDNAEAVIVIHRNGMVRTWGGIQEKRKQRWLRSRLREAFDLMNIFVPKDPDG